MARNSLRGGMELITLEGLGDTEVVKPGWVGEAKLAIKEYPVPTAIGAAVVGYGIYHFFSKKKRK